MNSIPTVLNHEDWVYLPELPKHGGPVTIAWVFKNDSTNCGPFVGQARYESAYGWTDRKGSMNHLGIYAWRELPDVPPPILKDGPADGIATRPCNYENEKTFASRYLNDVYPLPVEPASPVQPKDLIDRECVKCGYQWYENHSANNCPSCADAETFHPTPVVVSVEEPPKRTKRPDSIEAHVNLTAEVLYSDRLKWINYACYLESLSAHPSPLPAPVASDTDLENSIQEVIDLDWPSAIRDTLRELQAWRKWGKGNAK